MLMFYSCLCPSTRDIMWYVDVLLLRNDNTWYIDVLLLRNDRFYSSCQSVLVLITRVTMSRHICHICCIPGLNVMLVHPLSFHGNCLAVSHKLHF